MDMFQVYRHMLRSYSNTTEPYKETEDKRDYMKYNVELKGILVVLDNMVKGGSLEVKMHFLALF